MSSSYKDLEIFKLSFNLFVRTHSFSLKLPKYELYELGSQLRRSSDSVNSNIVEGYGRKVYKKDLIKFLIYSLSSNDETINHLEKIKIIYPQYEKEAFILIEEHIVLGKKINNFIQYVRKSWKT